MLYCKTPYCKITSLSAAARPRSKQTDTNDKYDMCNMIYLRTTTEMTRVMFKTMTCVR